MYAATDIMYNERHRQATAAAACIVLQRNFSIYTTTPMWNKTTNHLRKFGKPEPRARHVYRGIIINVEGERSYFALVHFFTDIMMIFMQSVKSHAHCWLLVGTINSI